IDLPGQLHHQHSMDGEHRDARQATDGVQFQFEPVATHLHRVRAAMSATSRYVNLALARPGTASRARAGARRGHAGFTMVELMVALTIGLLVTVGILTLLSSMKRNSTAQTGLAQLQDNERIAMNLIADLVQTAGYYGYGGNPQTLFPSTSTAPVF